ncbi:MAG: hypothetical protein WB506_08545, partial [Candidatus Sulfotelmatobacter sp.]
FVVKRKIQSNIDILRGNRNIRKNAVFCDCSETQGAESRKIERRKEDGYSVGNEISQGKGRSGQKCGGDAEIGSGVCGAYRQHGFGCSEQFFGFAIGTGADQETNLGGGA